MLLLANFNFGAVALIVVPVLLVLFFVTMLVRQYRRCPSNRVLVVYGKVSGQRAARDRTHEFADFVQTMRLLLNLQPDTNL